MFPGPTGVVEVAAPKVRSRPCLRGGSAAAPAPAAIKRRRLLVGLVVGLATLLAVRHDLVRDVRDQFLPKRWGVVEPGKIYRSGQISARLIRPLLEQHGIRRVVDLTLDIPGDRYHDAELAAISELGIERRLCSLEADGTGDVRIYAQAVADVAEAASAGKPVLVHCVAGTQRTGGVVAFYRLLVQEQDPADVLREMREYKYDPVRSPKLLAYLNAHMRDVAEELVRLGTIARVPETLPVVVAP